MILGIRTLVAVALGALGLLAFAGCGGDERPRKLRPPVPIAVTAEVDDDKVSISPDRFGAGLALITITNQADQAQTLVVEGPRTSRSSRLMEPGGTANLKVDLGPGVYQASAGAGAGSKAKPATLTVGPARPSAQNELLQP